MDTRCAMRGCGGERSDGDRARRGGCDATGTFRDEGGNTEMITVRDRKVWVAGRRVHHGGLGLLGMAVGVVVSAVSHRVGLAGAVGGLALMWHDRRDFPWAPVRYDGTGR